MRVVFCGGGTGGHVYPALTVAAVLRRTHPDAKLLYVGVRGKMDGELVAREGIEFRAVTAAALRVGNPLGAMRGLVSLLRGVVESYSILRRFRPDVVFATGGYGSVGVGIAARLLGLPLLVFLPDVAAGFAVKTLSRLASGIAVTVPPALDTMPSEKTVLTGYPVRPAFFEASRDEARVRFNLDPSLPTLLVMGGSTGASAINREIGGWAAEFLRSGQVLHICGRNDEDWLQDLRASLTEDLQARYHLHAYLHEDIALALAAADLAVLRAGASTLGELPAAGLPAVLIPGDFSDQRDNAVFLESNGAAVMLPQRRIELLQGLVEELLGDESRLAGMREAMASLARPDAATNLASVIATMAGVEVKVPA
jgi:UDP-N-acetylglucosamine--N-acetylmuramyl-(pentapeptide) pyrophosphoryl-undecaprenol N-acetylglucosamine transferase